MQWLAIIGLGAGVTFLGISNTKLSGRVAALQADNERLEREKTAHSEEEADLAREQTEELDRLKKENVELLRLRNEIRQLREDKQALNKQVQSVQVMAQNAQAQVQAAQAQFEAQAHAMRSNAPQSSVIQAVASSQQMGSPNAILTQDQLDARKRVGLVFDAATAQNACIVNLRHLDGAKQQWALENKKAPNSVPTQADLAPYLRNQLPVCPNGGFYTLGSVEAVPTCTQAGHILSQ